MIPESRQFWGVFEGFLKVRLLTAQIAPQAGSDLLGGGG